MKQSNPAAAAPWKQDRNTESSLSASHLMPAKERYKKKKQKRQIRFPLARPAFYKWLNEPPA